MFRTFELLVIEGVIVIVEWSMAIIVLIKDYGVRVWRNNVMRKWVFEILDLADARFRRIASYLEGIVTFLQCKIAFEKITKPMKLRYRELIGKKPL
jgi:hypothetical protein